MAEPTRTRIVRIGNARGVQIPRALLEHAGLDDEVTIEALSDRLVIRPETRPRAGWDEAFAMMASAGDDRNAAPGFLSTTWDTLEWEW